MNNKQLIIGTGTGRSGTVSLAVLLNEQENSDFTHEMRPILPWFPISEKMIEKRLDALLSIKAKFVGDIAGFYVRYIPLIVKKNSTVKVIIIERDIWGTVKSFLKHSAGKNNWQNGLEPQSEFSICTPKYPEALSKMDAIGMYVDEVQKETKELEIKYPDNVKIFKMDELNTKKGVKKILEFCGYEKKNIFHPHLNKYKPR